MLFFLQRIALLALSALDLLMLVRVILSWIPFSDTLADLTYSLTEPVILPIRKLFEKFGFDESALPIDIPFFVTFLLIGLVESLIA